MYIVLTVKHIQTGMIVRLITPSCSGCKGLKLFIENFLGISAFNYYVSAIVIC